MSEHRAGDPGREPTRPAVLPPVRPPLRDVIARHGLGARRSLGQHFLLDGNLTGRIVREAGSLAGINVVEVGPGPGGLTRALLDSDAATITVIEVDRRAIAALHELAAAEPRQLPASTAGEPPADMSPDTPSPLLADGTPDRLSEALTDARPGAPDDPRTDTRVDRAVRLRVLQADALRVDLTTLVPAPRAVVANLPYNIASPLLVGWLRQAGRFQHLTLMFQQEVAERICAAVDTPAYGRLGVLAQWVCETDIVLRLPPAAFVPPPKVWSAVVSLVPRPDQPPPDLFIRMERLTAAAFGQRRKMLRGALKGIGGEALLARAGISGERRAETLTIAEFDRLARCLD